MRSNRVWGFVFIGLLCLPSCKRDNIEAPEEVLPGIFKDACLTYASGDPNTLAACGAIKDTTLAISVHDLHERFVSSSTNSGEDEGETVFYYYTFGVNNVCANYETETTTRVYMHKRDSMNVLFNQLFYTDFAAYFRTQISRFGRGEIHWLQEPIKEELATDSSLMVLTYAGKAQCKPHAIATINTVDEIDDLLTITISFSKVGPSSEENSCFLNSYFSHFELNIRYAETSESFN